MLPIRKIHFQNRTVCFCLCFLSSMVCLIFHLIHSSVALIYTFSSSCFFRHHNPLFSTRLDLCSATHHRFRFSSSHRTLCFGRLAARKNFPPNCLDWSCKTHKKNRNHMNCLTAARTPREINTKFQSHKNVPIAQTHDQREETFNSTSLAYFSS